MNTRYILTAFGQDRVGIVADVTQIMYELGCNLEDSEMTRLSDEFAIIFLFSSTREDIEEKLSAACRRLELDKGLAAFYRKLGEPKQQQSTGVVSNLHVEGVDQCGIVYKVSRYLADNSINVIRLYSKQKFSPQSGTALYAVDLEVELPEHLDLDELKRGIRKVSDSLHVDIQIT